MSSLAKREDRRWNGSKKKIRIGSGTIIVALHILLWLSAAAIAAAALMLRDPADSTVLGSAVIILISGTASILYVLLHTHFSVRRRLGKVDDPAMPTFRQPVYIGVRFCGFVCLFWLVCTGWAVMVTVKSPVCNLRAGEEVLVSCSCQKAGTALSVVLLITSLILFILIQATKNPFDNSLFGKVDFEPAYEEKEANPAYNSALMQRSIYQPPTSSSSGERTWTSASTSVHKGKQASPSMEQLVRSGIKPPGSGYFATRSNVSIVDSHRILQSASCSSLNLSQSRPLRYIPSSNLMRSNNASRIGYHYRNISVSSAYSSRPSSRTSSFTDLPAYVSAASSITVPAPSAWKAIHPPNYHLHRSSSMNSLRSMTNSSTASLSMIHQHGNRARTSPSSASSSRGSPQAASWAHYRLHRATSSQSSTTSGSSRLGVVEEETRQPDSDARFVENAAVGDGSGSRKGKQTRYHHSSSSPVSARKMPVNPQSSSQSDGSKPGPLSEPKVVPKKTHEQPARYKKTLQGRTAIEQKTAKTEVSPKAAKLSKLPNRYARKKKSVNP